MDNLVDYLDRLSGLEKKCLVGVINGYGDLSNPITLGSLPFVNRSDARTALRIAIESANTETHARTLQVWHKAETTLSTREVNGVSSFMMYLDHERVAKWSKKVKTREGKPTFEIAMPFRVERDVSTKWQEFGRKWVRGKDNLNAVIRVRRVNNDVHEVTGLTSLRDAIVNYMFERYGIQY